MHVNDLGSAIERLMAAGSLAERWSAVTEILAGHGADVVNYAVLNTFEADRAEASVTQFSTMDPGWIDFYLAERLDLADPHVAYARESWLRPYYFDEDMAARLEPDAARVIRLAAEAGLRSQISVIAPDSYRPHEAIGGMTIGSSQTSKQFFAEIAGREAGLMAIALLFHSLSIGELRREQFGGEKLSPRERDCLTFLSLGERNSRIAERLGIAEVTVEMHLRNARRKLRAGTTAQAMARALVTGEIAI